jgi:cleavage stimulation factor subunit 3
MAKLFPDDPHLTTFAMRYQILGSEEFDPTRSQLLISMPAQAKPKAMPSIEREGVASSRESPAPPAGTFSPRAAASPRLGILAAPPNAARYSPKRPFPGNDVGESPPRKLARGESPLKGAAGRRLDAAKRRAAAAAVGTPPQQMPQMSQGIITQQQQPMGAQAQAPPELHRDINILLGMIPRRDTAAAWPSPGAGALLRMLQLVPPLGQQSGGGAAMMQRERSGQGGGGSRGGGYGQQQQQQGYQQRHYGYGAQ